MKTVPLSAWRLSIGVALFFVLTSFTIGEPANPEPVKNQRIMLALLLDTSNSMDGLIEQAKSQLWKIVKRAVGREMRRRSAPIDIHCPL